LRWHVSDSGEVGRQVHWSTVIHYSLGEYSDFEEDALWKVKPLKTDERARPLYVQNSGYQKLAVLQRLESTEDAESS